MTKIENLLHKHVGTFAPVMPFDFTPQNVYQLDLSTDNQELKNMDLSSNESVGNYIKQKLAETGKQIAIGGYAEDRMIYRKSEHFGVGENVRSIHLGIDIWHQAETAVFAPLDAVIHSFKNNDNYGDYGPAIILEHELEGTKFFSLYGHLSVESLKNKAVGQQIEKGEKFATLGDETENGNWSPHLHFQLMTDMLGNRGDFPGVSSQKDKAKFLKICPNPTVLLSDDKTTF